MLSPSSSLNRDTRGLMEKKKKKEDLMEMKKAPWKFALSPPDTVADIISGTWLDDGDELVFINTKVPSECAG